MGLKGIPTCLLAKCFLEAWGAKAQKPHVFQTSLLFGLAGEGGKAKTPFVFGKYGVVWPWYPGPSQKTLGEKNTSGSLGVSVLT